MSSDEDDEKMAELDEDFPNVGSDEEPDLEDKDVYPGDPGIDATDEQYEKWFEDIKKGGSGCRMNLFYAKQLRRHREKKPSIFDEDNSVEAVFLSKKLD